MLLLDIKTFLKNIHLTEAGPRNVTTSINVNLFNKLCSIYIFIVLQYSFLSIFIRKTVFNHSFLRNE